MTQIDNPTCVDPQTPNHADTVQTAKITTGQKGANAKYTRQGNPMLGPLTGREKEFEELGDLTAMYEGLATKTRQHVNPLADHFQVPTPAPDWATMFADPTLPLQIDIGCGSGRFCLIRARRLAGDSSTDIDADVDAAAEELVSGCAPSSAACTPSASSSQPTANILGLEIRQKLVDRAQAWSDRLHLSNCRFIFTNATVSFKSLLGSYPGRIELVSMQFPDPHFKTRHHKRRHVQPQLVEEMGELLPSGSQVFLQGDVPEAVRWMRDMIEIHGNDAFALAPECRGDGSLLRDEWETPGSAVEKEGSEEVENLDPSLDSKGSSVAALRWSADKGAGWLLENPLGAPTEREIYVGQIKAPVYRVMLARV